jgi:hypothetical protein
MGRICQCGCKFYTLFRALGYTKNHRVALTRTRLGLLTCGKHPGQRSQTDIYITDRNQNDIILPVVIHEEKHFKEGRGRDPEAQLIAETLASRSFGMNNEQKINAPVDPLDAKV